MRALNYDAAQAIRRRRASGERGIDIAAEYGVSAQIICDIVHRRRHAEPDRAHLERSMEGWRSRALEAERVVEILRYELSRCRDAI